MLNKFRYFCLNEKKQIYENSDSVPNKCKNNDHHNVDWSSLIIIEELSTISNTLPPTILPLTTVPPIEIPSSTSSIIPSLIYNESFHLSSLKINIINFNYQTILYFGWSITDFNKLKNGKLIISTSIDPNTGVDIQFSDMISDTEFNIINISNNISNTTHNVDSIFFPNPFPVVDTIIKISIKKSSGSLGNAYVYTIRMTFESDT